LERITSPGVETKALAMHPSSPNPTMTVAIDGPAAAGKSTIARAVAARLNLTYVDTGAMYRALTLKALAAGISPSDEAALARLAESTEIGLAPPTDPGSPQRVLLDGREVTREIRTRPVDLAVSAVSAHPAVRDWFRRLQRRMAEGGGVVMEGRDIGTVILPAADVKVYLNGTLECRVQRRYRELQEKGYRPALDEVREDMIRRDAIDSSRSTAPLTAAPDAVRVDTTDKTIDEVVSEVVGLCLERRGRR
jgi:cytidylate kinase